MPQWWAASQARTRTKARVLPRTSLQQLRADPPHMHLKRLILYSQAVMGLVEESAADLTSPAMARATSLTMEGFTAVMPSMGKE